MQAGINRRMGAMKSEKEKMLAGELFDPRDPELSRERERCREIFRRFNATPESQKDETQRLLGELFGKATDAWIQQPFFCDYGTNITLGTGVFFNFNCVVLDVAPVTIGDHVLVGPAVQIYTATHPVDPVERRSGLESGKPVSIGSDVWLGGGVIICPGVTIGDRAVIGAGSVVVRDIPADAVAAGNPARVIRMLAPASENAPAITIRTETPADHAAITAVTVEAFKTLELSGHTEQFIIAALRAASALSVSLVAELGGKVVGHIAFSPIAISDGTTNWYGLGPVSVLPELHRRGIGKALVREGLARLRAMNAGGCCLVGHPEYYTKFGFRNAPELVLEGVPPEVFFALPLDGRMPRGTVTFHEAFTADH